ncbi:hypothetical protein [Vibrio sp. 10N.247.310.34]|uniref:hypothetical protein n=1 Tax=Vibrio sp. 10N.247.310.34 TaxID=3229982 RepID=UPI00354FFB00
MDYLLFFTICVAATFSPGPAVLLTVKNSAVYGVERAVSGILGNIAAMITMAGLSATGLVFFFWHLNHYSYLLKWLAEYIYFYLE